MERACYPLSVVRGRKNPGFMSFPSRLRKARQSAGFSRQGLTQRASLAGQSTMLGWEQGLRIPRLDAVEQVAYALGLSPAFLAYGIESDGSKPIEGLRCEGVALRLQIGRASCRERVCLYV